MATTDPLRAPRAVLSSPQVEAFALGGIRERQRAEDELIHRIHELTADVPSGDPLVLILARADTGPDYAIEERASLEELSRDLAALKVGEALRITRAAVTPNGDVAHGRFRLQRTLEIQTALERETAAAVARDAIIALREQSGNPPFEDDVIEEIAARLDDRLRRALEHETNAPRVLGHDTIAVSRELLEEIREELRGVRCAERRRTALAAVDKLIRALDLEAGA